MFIYKILSFFILFKYIISSKFNNDFNHMFFKKTSFILYLGTEIVYFKINSSIYTSDDNNINITYNYTDKYLDFYCKNENKTYTINSNSNYNISYLENTKILFKNESEQFILQFTKYATGEKNEDNNINNIKTYNIYYNISNNITFYVSNGENFFITKYMFSFVLLLCGYFSILYGAYHYMFGLVIHSTLFFYFFVIEFIEVFDDRISETFVELYLFFCFLVSLSMSHFLKTKKKDNKKYMILKIIHGMSFGYSFFKIFSFYFIFNFEGYENEQIRTVLYFGLLALIIIAFGVILNLFNPYKKYIFLPCSTVSGTYYLIKGISYIIGGYFSDILAIKENLFFNYVRNHKEINAYHSIFSLLLIIFSIIFQINHIQYKLKEIEIKETAISRDSNEVSRISNLLDNSSLIKKEYEEELIDKSQENNNTKDEEDNDNEINDQED